MPTVNGQPTLRESLGMERDPGVADASLSASGRIRRILLDGEWHTISEIIERLGLPGDSALPTAVRKQMKSLGFKFAEEKVTLVGSDGRNGWGKRFCCTNPRHRPSETAFKAMSEASNNAHAKANRRRQRSVPSKAIARRVEPPPREAVEDEPEPAPIRLPPVDTPLTVYLAMRQFDGTALLGLRNGTESWVLTVNAHSVEQ
jgi:hypothetical protein